LLGPAEVDVAIISAGFTRPRAAYRLPRQEPPLTVAVVEAEVADLGVRHATVRAALRREGSAAR
jgi:hypothetical protein